MEIRVQVVFEYLEQALDILLGGCGWRILRTSPTGMCLYSRLFTVSGKTPENFRSCHASTSFSTTATPTIPCIPSRSLVYLVRRKRLLSWQEISRDFPNSTICPSGFQYIQSFGSYLACNAGIGAGDKFELLKIDLPCLTAEPYLSIGSANVSSRAKRFKWEFMALISRLLSVKG